MKDKQKSIKKILIVFGTRPEAIKMAPLIRECKKHKNIQTKVCVTAQHREMLDHVLAFFKIIPDYDLNIMKPNQTLFDIVAECMKKLEAVLNEFKPDLIFVQGDTTTAFVGALAGYYKQIKVAHLEAGLRSGNKNSPYPEEINRILAGHIADYHFAPTKQAKQNLNKENIKQNIWIVGNTVIDALFWGLDIIKAEQEDKIKSYFKFYNPQRKIILVTGHRRESFGKPFEAICHTLKRIAKQFPEMDIVYPVHLNPNVQKPVYSILSDSKNIHLIEPLDYSHLIWLMQQSFLVLTDSGGIQEEAPSLGKPVLVMRDVTERMEGVKAGNAILVGTNPEKIFKETCRLIRDPKKYKSMIKNRNPYGDGNTSKQILDILTHIDT